VNKRDFACESLSWLHSEMQHMHSMGGGSSQFSSAQIYLNTVTMLISRAPEKIPIVPPLETYQQTI
jgi:hypothetical protein